MRIDRSDTHLGKGGGLLVYAKPSVTIVPLTTTSDFNQHCRFKIQNDKEEWHVTLIYRPPSSPPENCDHLLQLLDNLPANSILVGDFNYPYIDWESLTSPARGRNFLNKCGTCSFEQLIDFPTHIKGNILDLVLTNNPEKSST